MFKLEASSAGLTSLLLCHFVIAVNRVAARGTATIMQQTNLWDQKCQRWVSGRCTKIFFEAGMNADKLSNKKAKDKLTGR